MQTALDNRFVAFLKLIRVENLLMIVVTQVLLRYFVLQKVLNNHLVSLQLDDALFYMVVLSTVLIAAGGYIINDYFDLKTDLINHPETVVVDRIIKRRWAIILHLSFTFLGLLIGMYAALKTGYLRLALFHVVAAILLWFYSTDFKRQLLIGNVIVALLTAAVAFMPFVYEMGNLQRLYPNFIFDQRHVVFSAFKFAWIFSVFAFITTLAREIIKDMEDYEGDKATGCKTLPIVWGNRAGRISVFFLLLITAILLLFVVYNSFRFNRVLFSLSNFYILIGLVIPLLALSYYVLRSKLTGQFKKASLWLKVIMLLGLFYSFIFYYYG